MAESTTETVTGEEAVTGERTGGASVPCRPVPAAALDRRQLLIEQTIRFAVTFLRRMDASACGSLSYPRLVLLKTLHCQGPTMMAELAARLEVSARNMTAIVDALESSGLVVRRPHPTDRRATLVELTPEGARTLDTTYDEEVESLGGLFGCLSAEDEGSFLRLVDRLTTAMERGAVERGAEERGRNR